MQYAQQHQHWSDNLELGEILLLSPSEIKCHLVRYCLKIWKFLKLCLTVRAKKTKIAGTNCSTLSAVYILHHPCPATAAPSSMQQTSQHTASIWDAESWGILQAQFKYSPTLPYFRIKRWTCRGQQRGEQRSACWKWMLGYTTQHQWLSLCMTVKG